MSSGWFGWLDTDFIPGGIIDLHRWFRNQSVLRKRCGQSLIIHAKGQIIISKNRSSQGVGLFIYWQYLGIQDLSSLSMDQTHAPCIGSFNHWTTREVPMSGIILIQHCNNTIFFFFTSLTLLLRLDFIKWKRVDQDRFWVEGERSCGVTKPGSRLSFLCFPFQRLQDRCCWLIL